ncbi:RNase Sy [Conidiobolus coronatus NRRL 28638]|uniref:ribonuclease T2 n=1 Tax=Conidiobolus coronatus (strain ATCC 28846 / CBS 209.66 / NRRL 28638) TaxID=796925 RepID=A0A137P9B1_CONC2|nr:RNase Sy [Conidiobolus coronatus NRRL 28638]|eukprot:KXN71534.1 RNase Sy [Conidiobolus coronatus NRRL 28638]
MKFITSIVSIAALVSGLQARCAKICPEVLSCKNEPVDSCCSPSLGLAALALQWTAGMGPADQWTIHGLWPNRCDGTWPENGCDPARNYTNIGEIVASDPALQTKMTTFWPSNKGVHPPFWTHEWVKHGTCLSTVEPRCSKTSELYADVKAYFNLTLKLREKFNLYQYLKDGGVVPGRTYTREQIEAAFKKALNAKVTLTCKGKKLLEVVIYNNFKGKDDLVPIDSKDPGNCPSTGIEYDPK